jgi:hypothetical protein
MLFVQFSLFKTLFFLVDIKGFLNPKDVVEELFDELTLDRDADEKLDSL